MSKANKSSRVWLLLALILAPLFVAAYIKLRPLVFEALAAGTDWVLVACGFANREDLMTRDDDRWRRLYYAIRMFKSAPPRQLIPEDALADRQYPGMGFGIVHTFSRAPVSRVIGGWLFNIPCVYFTDAQDCQDEVSTIARLSVDTDSLAPISQQTIEQFLSVKSIKVMRITLKGLTQRPRNWWLVPAARLNDLPRLADAPAGYDKYILPAEYAETDNVRYDLYVPKQRDARNNPHNQLQCLDARWAMEKHILDYCLSRFMYNDSVVVEIKFPTTARDHWPQLREAVEKLVREFQVRR